MSLLFLLSLISFAFSFSVFCREGRSQPWFPLHYPLSFRCHPQIPLSLKNSATLKTSFKFLCLFLLFLHANHFKTQFLLLLHLPFFFGQPLVVSSTMCCCFFMYYVVSLCAVVLPESLFIG